MLEKLYPHITTVSKFDHYKVCLSGEIIDKVSLFFLKGRMVYIACAEDNEWYDLQKEFSFYGSSQFSPMLKFLVILK
jgi:hypothetical protein